MWASYARMDIREPYWGLNDMRDDTQGHIFSGGHVMCPDCEGEGTVTCMECDGHNQWDCDECNGRGHRECDLGHDHDCTNCEGSGRITCENCDEGQHDCGLCYGSGEVMDPDRVTDEGL